MKTYLITGGAGFIGSTLADRLLDQDSNKVIVLDNFSNYYDVELKEENVKQNFANNRYDLIRGDIRDKSLVERIFVENDIDTVVHLAAMAGVRPSIENPVLYQDVNAIGTQNILEAMRRHEVKQIVMASSSSVYGNSKVAPFREDMSVDFAISPYAATKKANEVMAHVYHSLYQMNVIMLRFFTVYGPRQRPDLAINKFTRLIRQGEVVPIYGDGSTSRDYTYVDDIVDGIISSADYLGKIDNVYEIINLGGSSPISLIDMVSTISRSLNLSMNIEKHPMQSGDVDHTYADISKARLLLGYSPSTSFEEGIRKFIAWSNRDRN